MNKPIKADTDVVDAAHVARLRENGEPLFGLGNVYGTPAVLAHLAKHGLRPNALLGKHCHGEYGELDDEDREANERSIVDGSRILSVYTVEAERIYVITEACNESGARYATTILFAEEY